MVVDLCVKVITDFEISIGHPRDHSRVVTKVAYLFVKKKNLELF